MLTFDMNTSKTIYRKHQIEIQYYRSKSDIFKYTLIYE